MAEFKLGRIRFIWKGSWAANTPYLKDDIIRNGGKTYVCVIGHTSSVDFTADRTNNPTRWDQVSDGTTWTADWTINQYYRLNDIVKYGGMLYVCNTTHTSAATLALGLEPDLGKWDIYASSFDWKSTWVLNTRYKKNDVVKYGADNYICTQGHTSAATDALGLESDSGKWNKFSNGVKWTTDWLSNTRYKVHDVVRYGGQTYVCNLGHTSAATAELGLEADQNRWDYFHKGIVYLGQWSDSSVRYKVNDIVNYGADIWICTTYHTSSATFAEENWARFIEGLTYENTWSNATTYQPGDIVGYGGYSYISKSININKIPSTNTNDWGLFTTGFEFIGDWQTAQTYKVGNILRNGGYTYVVTLDHTSSSLNQPPNLTYWSRLNSGIKWANTNRTYTGLSGTNIIGSGTSATFDVTTNGTSYTVTKNAVGSGYAANNTIKILGTSVGGITPYNDITITVTAVTGGNGISTITSTGIATTWSINTEYVAGDTVSYGPSSYICILAHTGSAGNSPGADMTATYWNCVAAGSSNLVLTTTGDIPYFGLTGPSRLPIGSAGQVLKVSANLLPSWGYFGIIDQVYYVSPNGVNNPAPDYGVTLDRPWLTIRYATEQIENGALNNNATYLLKRNRSYIQKEVIAWINYQITNSIAPFVGFSYNNATCERDIGYVVDALAYDISHGGNARSVAVAQSYVSGSYALLGTQKTQDVAGYNQLISVINAVIANSAPSTTYQSTVTRISDVSKVLESGVTTLVTNLVKVITDAITAGVSTNIPAVVTTTYTIFVKTGIYYETLPIIIPVNTAIVGDELRSSNVRPRSIAIASTDVQYSLASLNRVQTIISNVVQNIAVTPTSGNTLTATTTRPAGSAAAGTAAQTLISNFRTYVDYYINSTGSAPTLVGTNTPVATAGFYDAVEVLEANKEFLAQEAVAYTNFTYSTTVTATAANGNITVSNSTNFTVGMPVVFSGTVGASTIVVGTTYYVKTSSGNVITVSATSGGTALNWSATSGMSFTVRLAYDSAACARDVRAIIDSMKYDLIYTGNYKTLLCARYYRRCVQTSVTEDMFYVRNATGLRNMTVQGLTGSLGTANSYGTQRPTAGSYVSLDPGWGPADNRTWITSRSPYVQNVTTFGTGCVGLKIDGTLHNGGNRSVVANDFTQILSDGIGVWCTGANSLTELVSVFSYYGHIGYLAEHGGKIRATNGNSSYGTYGTVAEGIDSTETPLISTVNNRGIQALITNVVTNAVDKIYRVEFLNAGTNYNTATYSFSGTGYGVDTIANEFRDNAVFETRVLTTGANYVTSANTGQAGNTTQFTIAAVDQAISSAYVGMRIQITAGLGVGQYGYIVSYNSGSKIAKVAKDSFPSMTATGTTSSSDVITVASTSTLTANMPLYFGSALANLSANTIYYVKTIVSATTFTVSTIAAGTVFDINADTSAQTVTVHAAGWDHVVSGTPSASILDTTSTYIIEPRIRFSAPAYNAASTTASATTTWSHMAYGDLNATYTAVSVTGGAGSSATFTVVRTGVAYTVTLTAGGTNYVIGNTLTIAGTSLGGTATNNITVTVTNVVSGTGVITNFTYSGVGAGGRFVAIQGAGTQTTYNTTGSGAWSVGGNMPVSSQWTGLAYGVVSGISTWVAVQNGSNNTATTTNGGTTWIAGGTLTASGDWGCIGYGNGTFITSLATTTTTNISINGGATWTAGGNLPTAIPWSSIAFGAGTWVAVNGNSSQTAAYSTNNGASWTATTLPTSSSWTSVTYGNGKFVAVAYGTAAAYSLDGITWYAVTLPITSNWRRVKYGQGVFVATTLDAGNTVLSSENGIIWTSRFISLSATWLAIDFGNPNSTPGWALLPYNDPGTYFLTLGATAKGRVKVSTGLISEFRIVEPGSGYNSTPTLTITDPNATSAMTYTVRTGVGALANPTFINRGTEYAVASATVTGNGAADLYQPGNYVNVSGLTASPIPGSNITFAGDSTYYKVVSVLNFLGTGGGQSPYNATIQLSPTMTAVLAPNHGVTATFRIKYSQVRLTGHDFLNIGTGNFSNTNFPGTPVLAVDANKQTVQNGGGRVFYTSTDQDGNFTVGNLFSVQQATGVATLNADAFNIAGLNQLTLGAVTLGGTSATITSFSTDPYFTANSDSVVPTQKAIKAYISSQIGGGGSALNVNTLTAGVIYIAGNTISTTTGEQISVNNKMNFIGGIDGSPLAMNFLLN